MDTIIKFLLFFLGIATSIFLIPIIEKRKSEAQRKESLKQLFIELDDIYDELSTHLRANFYFLLNIRTEEELAQTAEIPVPGTKDINTSVLDELYKKSALLLTSSQRLAIKRIPASVNEVMRHTESSFNSFLNHTEYNIQSTKNVIKLSCVLVHEMNSLREHKERFIFDISINSNTAVLPVLKSLGFTDEEIEKSRIQESRFSNVKVDF